MTNTKQMNKPQLTIHPQNNSKMNQRSNSVDAWLDENLRYIETSLFNISQIEDEIEKQWEIICLFKYFSMIYLV